MDALTEKHFRRITAGLALAAAVRVFIFAAAFPFFSNVDEYCHFDMVVKYARGYTPSPRDAAYDPESIRSIVLYWSPEYWLTPDAPRPAGLPPAYRRAALWRVPPTDETQAIIQREQNRFEQASNREASSPPFYYWVAGGWYDGGKFLGLRGLALLYWVRFLNPLIFAATVWTAGAFSRSCFPSRPTLRLGVPALVAFFPQDTFYMIASDALVPFLGGLALYLVLQVSTADRGGRAWFLAGLALAAAVLTKWPNAVLVPLAFLVLGLGFSRRWYSIRTWRNPILFLAALGLPIGACLVWNYVALGDPLGKNLMIQLLGWREKPFTEWGNSPVLTLKGALTCGRELTASFWRGEFIWNNQRLASPCMDGFYTLISLVFPGWAVAHAFNRRSPLAPRERLVWLASAGGLALSLVFLVWISLRIDYGHHPIPLSVGRFLLGGLIPFAALFVQGLDLLLARFRIAVHPLVILSPLLLLITLSEIHLTWPVFANADNWYHLFGTSFASGS